MSRPPSILALDPGTITGWATTSDSGTWDLEPKKAAPSKGRKAEAEWSRVGKLHEKVFALVGEGDTVVVEGAAAFMRGKAAVKVSHELRGAIKAACWVRAAVYEEVQPQDWKKVLFGRGDVLPAEYLARAQTHLRYAGESEDEAAALWLLEWARRYRTEQHETRGTAHGAA